MPTIIDDVATSIRRIPHVLTPLVPLTANAVFWILLAVSIIPVWTYPWVASGDGPSHLYNSKIFLQYATEAVYQRAYTVQVPFVGNLVDRVLCMGLLRAGVPAAVVEKILVTICLLSFALAFRYLLRASKADYRTFAVLVLPFLFNYPLEMGFWSFSLGVSAMLVSVAISFREQGHWTWRSALIFFIAVLGVYTCHPLCWGIAALAAGTIAIVRDGPGLLRPELRKRAAVQILTPALAFIPVTVPALLLAQRTGRAEWTRYSSWREPLWPFYTLAPLHVFHVDGAFARALALVLCLMTAIALSHVARGRSMRQTDVYLAIAAGVAVMAIAGPERVGELSFLSIRFVFIAWLFALLWLAGALSGTRYSRVISLGLAAFALLWFVYRVPVLSKTEADLSEFVSVASHIKPRSLVCLIDRRKQKPTVDFLAHAVDLIMDKHIVDLNNYEAARQAFWTRFRPGYDLDEDYRHPSTLANLEGALARFDARTGRSIDYVVVIDPDVSPQQTIRRLLPNRWPEFEIEQPRGIRIAYLLHHHPVSAARSPSSLPLDPRSWP